MALSRIWSAFIIIALGMALFNGIRFHNTGLQFSSMVTGKAGDTVSQQLIPASEAPAYWAAATDSGKILQAPGYSVIKNKSGDFQTFKIQSADGIIETCKSSVSLALGLIGIMALFMGFMSIAEKAGGIRLLARWIGPFFSKIFPEVPKGHPAMGHMVMNFSANLLGLDNAATPFGLKAMESLQELNPEKEKASNAQIMFLALHASGLTLIPVSIIAMRVAAKSANPMSIFIPCMMATFVATLAAIIIVSLKQRIRLFQPVILLWLLSIAALMGALVTLLHQMNSGEMQSFSAALSNGLILLIFLLIVLGGWYKRINVFESFVEGAKSGFEVAVRIIPYLVGILVAISLLRTSGSFEVVIVAVKDLFAAIGTDTRFVDALPTALIKPFSGSGARGMMVDAMRTFGADSFAGQLSCIFQGSSDTTFYVIAVYFGAVAVKNTRYAIWVMLLADLAGILTSILLAYLFFG